MHAKNICRFNHLKPMGAIGKVTVDYVNPVTNKLYEQIKGLNHVFEDSLFASTTWLDDLSSVYLWLTDSTKAIDTSLPFLLGNPIGYGTPNGSASGIYKGNWNSASGYLAQATSTGISFKYVYDFAPSQVTEEVKSIGLTQQYNATWYKATYKRVARSAMSFSNTTYIFYGAYAYYVSSGIAYKKSIMDSSISSVDISSTVGTSNLAIGVDGTTGKFYIKVYSATAADRKVYVYSDDTFSTLENTYTVTTMTDSNSYSFGVGNGIAYDLVGTTLYITDFINDICSTDTLTYNAILSSIFGLSNTAYRMRTVFGKYLLFGFDSADFQSFIFNTDTGEVDGYTCSNDDIYYAYHPHLLDTSDAALYSSVLDYTGPSYDLVKNATTAYKLPVDAPTRPAGYGMTITYELEVQY